MEGVTYNFNERGMNVLTAVDPTTGTLTMKYPLRKNYTSNPPHISDVANETFYNNTVEGGTYIVDSGALFIMQQIIGYYVRNVTIDAYPNNMPNMEPFEISYIMDGQFTNLVARAHCMLALDLSTRGITNALVDSPNLTIWGTGCGSWGGGIATGEGVENITIQNGTVVNTTDSQQPGGIAAIAYDDTVSRMNITGAGIVTSNGYASATNANLTGNTINVSSGYGILLAGTTLTATNNMINGGCILAYNTSVMDGNTCNQTYNGIVMGFGAQAGTRISNTTLRGPGASAGAGILLTDPGSVLSQDATVTNTLITNFATPISIWNPANEPNFYADPATLNGTATGSGH
jgi:hypothetical protein